MESLLQDKVAIVYGAGSIGRTIAQAFAREGARVFIGARTEGRAAKLVAAIQQEGGQATAGVVDVLDQQSVSTFVAGVAAQAGRIDITFCATNVTGGKQGAALNEITWEDFFLPLEHYTKSQFLTANAASKYMVQQSAGVIMMITAIPSHIPIPYTTGFGPAWAAIEALSKTLAAELGPHGVRTVYLHSSGSPESQESIDQTFVNDPIADQRMKEWKFVHRNLVGGKHPTLAQVGYMAAFMASDKAGCTSGTFANLSSGMVNE
ncbi:SDR family NAD(P)-dependent oxidoreductase [Paraflavitalea pollutisoli]|uniref:SDR family NAD(P)-dependent oxidoreductase n=1 Tax=Paraflavitalea pollutisoli TaxID=3034143 RepID=UPI0023EA7C50|nr:SDR family oxidoreductase [Paraflavitalea sp. H1-2-19X]